VALDDLLNARQVAQLLGLSTPRSVYVYRGRYPGFPEPVLKDRRCMLWLRADVEAWQRSRSPAVR
jgi:predicted DNA-binding transcriptional regulator AlpA